MAPDEIEKELQFHIDERTSDLVARGQTPEEARRQARAEFGGMLQVHEDCRGARQSALLAFLKIVGQFVASLQFDTRQTFRWLRREPVLATAMLATLTIAIGTTTAVFSVLDAVMIRPLPYANPNRLVVVWQQDRTTRAWFTVSAANFLDWRTSSAFDSVAAVQQFQDTDFNLSGGSEPETVKGIRVSADLFRVLGVLPTLGRPFTAADNQPSSDLVVILQHDLWVNRFGGDPSIIGQVIVVNGERARVVGVMPLTFEVPNEVVHAQLLLPIRWTAAQRQERGVANYFVLARLKDDVSVGQAAADLDVLARRLEQQYPVDNRDTGVFVQPLRDQIVGNVGDALVMMFAAAAGVLVLACFNLANLLTARGIKRQPELSVRAALGASRTRLVRQTLVEGLAISGLGGMGGLLLGPWAVNAFIGLFNDTRYFSLPRRAEIALDWRVFLFVVCTCVATALLFSVAPARRALKADVVAVLHRTDGRLERRWRNILMSTQLAIALMLVIVGMQMVRSCARLQNQERGFQPDDVLTARIAVPEARYPTAATRADFFRRLLAQARQLPDTAEAAAVQLLPLRGVASLRSVARPDQVSDNMPSAFHFIVSPRYFETLTIPLLVGRTFNDLDTRSRARVVILSRAAAERYFPNENPIGRKLWIKDGMNADWKVIGIVGDIRNQRLDRAPQPQIYVPLDQNPTAVMTVVLRSHDHNPLALARPFRDVVHALDVEQGVSDVRLMTQVVDDSVARWRVPTNLFVAFGSVAVLLALFGLYSITTFTVAMRSREIAVRVALGGSRRSVVGLLMRSIAVLCGAGVGVGLMVSVAVARALSSLLFAVTPVDAIPFGLASVAFATLVLGTGAWTACRTTDMQPADVLKMD